jgi:phage/conjugal plasmid C-4 type zinc finger TraR family protein
MAALLILIGLLLLWQLIAVSVGPGPDILPSPLLVIEQGWADRSDLWANTLPTIGATAIGFACSLALAFLLSIVIDRFHPARRSLMPVHAIHNNMNAIANVRRQLEQQAAQPSLTHCEECGDEIPKKRQELIKGVRLCVFCQQMHERR